MKIKSIKLNGFKRFSDLTITEIPETAKLIVLVGPNGSGKTSLFEAFNHWYKLNAGWGVDNQDYIAKKGEPSSAGKWYQNKVKIDFFSNQQLNREQVKGKFYFRSAYRNEPDFTINNLNKQINPTSNIKLQNLMQNDLTVSENYQILVAQTLASVYKLENKAKTVEQLREELIGNIITLLSTVLASLTLSYIGYLFLISSFYF